MIQQLVIPWAWHCSGLGLILNFKVIVTRYGVPQILYYHNFCEGGNFPMLNGHEHRPRPGGSLCLPRQSS